MIGRCADHKYHYDTDDLKLADKIKFLLDDLFLPFGYRR